MIMKWTSVQTVRTVKRKLPRRSLLFHPHQYVCTCAFRNIELTVIFLFWYRRGGGSLHVSTSDEFRVQKCFLTKFVPIFASFSFLKFYESNLKLRNLFLILRK